MTDHRAMDRQRMGSIDHSRQRTNDEKREPDTARQAAINACRDHIISTVELERQYPGASAEL